MKIKKLLLRGISMLAFTVSNSLLAQVPTAGFSISPNPVCSGAANVIQITDNSSNSPTSWSYVVSAGGPNSATLTTQNPTLSVFQQGTYTITLVATNGAGASTPVTHTLQVLASPNVNVGPASQTTCVGGSPVTLSAMAAGPGGANITYSWSTGSTASSIAVTPSVTTTYSCIITSTNGCSIERTSTVVIGQPTVGFTSNPSSICPGSTSTIAATGTAPAPFTYSWSTGATTRTIAVTVAGSYTVTVTNGNGCTATGMYSIGTSTVLSLTATSNPTSLCAGNSALIRVTGASSYTWSTGVMTQTFIASPTTSTVYTVTGQVGTCTGTASIALTVNSTPTITATANHTSVCAGNSVILNASGATTYSWLPTTLSQTTSVSPTVSTTYTVRGNNPGCPNRTATISIAVAPKPVVMVSSSSSIVCAGEAVALAASGALTYTWSGGATTAVVLITPTITSTYTVIGTNSSNCSSAVSITQNVSACSGISKQENEINTLQVFPNPTSGSFNLKSGVDADLNIIDQAGQLIRVYTLNVANERSITINDLPAGIYFVIGNSSVGILKQKIVVLK